MNIYTISTKAGEKFTVKADSYPDAADAAVRRLNKGKRNLLALRVTGSANLSGWWQGYTSSKYGGLNSTGPQFHIA